MRKGGNSMPKIAIITDSNSGLTQEQATELGIIVVPMPFNINQKDYEEGVNLTQDMFFEMLEQGAEVSTSQPSIGKLSVLFEETLKEYDEIVYMPMTSGLSGSYQSARMLAEDFDNRVFVVDNKRISATLEEDVYNAIELARQGKTGAEIRDFLENNSDKCSIFITVPQLKYLVKGGRVTPAVGAIGGLLKIKPILSIGEEKIDLFTTSRTTKKAEKIMIEALQNDINNRVDKEGQGKNVLIRIAHSHCLEDAENFKTKLQEAFPEHEIKIVPLALSIACHTGPGAIGCGCILKTVQKDA